MRDALKLFAHWVAVLIVSPSLISWHVRSMVMGPDRAIEGSTQFWAIVPGLIGQYLRRAFLCHTLSFCARSATIEFGTLFSSASASIGERAYIGPRCHLGWAVIEADVLVAAGVHIPSGKHTHGTDNVAIPIREQSGRRERVSIGSGSWIGNAPIQPRRANRLSSSPHIEPARLQDCSDASCSVLIGTSTQQRRQSSSDWNCRSKFELFRGESLAMPACATVIEVVRQKCGCTCLHHRGLAVFSATRFRKRLPSLGDSSDCFKISDAVQDRPDVTR